MTDINDMDDANFNMYDDDNPDYSGVTSFSYGVFFAGDDFELPTQDEIEEFLTGKNIWKTNFRLQNDYGFQVDLPYNLVFPSLITKAEAPDIFDTDKDGFILKGLEDFELEQLKDSDRLFLLRYIGPNYDDKRHILFLMLIAELYRSRFNGIIIDNSTYVFWGEKTWLQEYFPNVLNNDYLVEYFVTFHEEIQNNTAPDGEQLIWMHTHGLGRFSVPELEIINLRRDLWNVAFEIMIELAQDMIEGTIYNAGDVMFEQEKHKVRFVESKPFSNKNPMEHYEMGRALRLVDFADETDTKLDTFLLKYDEYVRSQEIINIENDTELDDARIDALKHLSKFKDFWTANKDNTDEYYFLVKYGVAVNPDADEADNAKEMLWLHVHDWKERKLSTIIDSRPLYCQQFQEGDSLAIEEKDIVDWCVYNYKGEMLLGGYVQRILDARSDAEDF